MNDVQIGLSDIQEVMNRLEDVEEDVENLKEVVKKIRGGKQPSSNIKVEGENNGPAKHTAKVLKAVKNSSKRKPVDKNDVKNILEDQGIQRTDKPVLNYMRKLDDKYSFCELRPGEGSRPTQLYHDK